MCRFTLPILTPLRPTASTHKPAWLCPAHITVKSGLTCPSQTQATLILTSRLATTPESLMSTLPILMQELVGFFIIEAHVLRSMPDFRSRRDVDELWDEMCKRIVEVMGQGLKGCGQPEVFLESKTNVLLFVQTLEVSRGTVVQSADGSKGYEYNITELNGLLITLFERYSELLLRKFSTDFDQVMPAAFFRTVH